MVDDQRFLEDAIHCQPKFCFWSLELRMHSSGVQVQDNTAAMVQLFNYFLNSFLNEEVIIRPSYENTDWPPTFRYREGQVGRISPAALNSRFGKTHNILAWQRPHQVRLSIPLSLLLHYVEILLPLEESIRELGLFDEMRRAGIDGRVEGALPFQNYVCAPGTHGGEKAGRKGAHKMWCEYGYICKDNFINKSATQIVVHNLKKLRRIMSNSSLSTSRNVVGAINSTSSFPNQLSYATLMVFLLTKPS